MSAAVRPHRLLILVLLAATVLGAVTPGSATSDDGRAGGAASLRSEVRTLELRVNFVRNRVRRMERSARAFRVFMKCVKWVPVSEYGDPDHRFGFRYDELDGTGLDLRPALAIASRRRGADYIFLRFSRQARCQSATTKPGTPSAPGTADPASVHRGARSTTSLSSSVRRIGRKLRNLTKRAERLERMSERFEDWESCLSWVPVTEYGDPDRQFGFHYGRRGAAPGYRPALALDISEWDDPDYMFLAFAGRDRPFTARECENEPGESVD